MFVAKIDLRYRSALYCSAGHPPSMLVRNHTLGAGGETHTQATEVELLSTQSGVVGAFEGMAFRSGSFRFDSGDVLFMYTDGAIEARNAANNGQRSEEHANLAKKREVIEKLKAIGAEAEGNVDKE